MAVQAQDERVRKRLQDQLAKLREREKPFSAKGYIQSVIPGAIGMVGGTIETLGRGKEIAGRHMPLIGDALRVQGLKEVGLGRYLQEKGTELGPEPGLRDKFAAQLGSATGQMAVFMGTAALTGGTASAGATRLATLITGPAGRVASIGAATMGARSRPSSPRPCAASRSPSTAAAARPAASATCRT